MLRVSVVLATLAALGLPVAGHAAPDLRALEWTAAREALGKTASDDTAVFDRSGGPPRVFPTGDLNDDGLTDALLAVPRDGSPDGAMGTGAVELQAIDAATGEPLWAHEFARAAGRDANDVRAELEGAVWVSVGGYLDGDLIADVVVANIDPAAGSTVVTAIAAVGGAVLWERSDVAASGTVAGGTYIVHETIDAASAGVAVPLDSPADVDRDTADDLLIGRFVGTRLDAGGTAVGAWHMELALLSGSNGSDLLRTAVQSVGPAPSGIIASVTWNEGNDVVIASSMRQGTENVASITVFDDYSRGVFFGQWPSSTPYQVRAPARDDDFALSLRRLPRAAYNQDGLLIGFDTSPTSSTHPLRGTITGPATLVGVARSGIESMRVTLPSGSVVQQLGDVNGDEVADVRTVRVDLDSLIVETWSGQGTNVALLPAHQMTFLEGDDYAKDVDVHAEMRDADGDGVLEILIGGGYPCGPRFQVIGGASGSPLWEVPERRAMGCFGRLFPAGASLDGAGGDDVVDWTTQWFCCSSGLSPFRVDVTARGGATGAEQWTTALPDLGWAAAADGAVVTGDGLTDVIFAATAGSSGAVHTYRFDGEDGSIAWARVA